MTETEHGVKQSTTNSTRIRTSWGGEKKLKALKTRPQIRGEQVQVGVEKERHSTPRLQ